jgi:hydrogenase expression/formation protein HypD
MDPLLLREERSIKALLSEVSQILSRLNRRINIMEVCGTHTMTAYRSGLRRILGKKSLKLISGPGCPVCVTPDGLVNAAVSLVTGKRNVILASFGDMLKVPTEKGSLLSIVPAQGSEVITVYSPEEAVNIAAANPSKQVVFFGVGFETTIPAIAWAVLETVKKSIKNLSFITSLHLVPPPLRAILTKGASGLDGFLYPGHVSVITGTDVYEFIPGEFGLPGAVTGFEPADLILGILSVLKQIESGKPEVAIAYTRAVRPGGNPKARELMEKAFEISDVEWRGFGMIPGSGLKLKDRNLDAVERFSLDDRSFFGHGACRCGEIVTGNIEPYDCPMFKNGCTPETPFGPCMVSVEGACLICYKYGESEIWTESL